MSGKCYHEIKICGRWWPMKITLFTAYAIAVYIKIGNVKKTKTNSILNVR